MMSRLMTPLMILGVALTLTIAEASAQSRITPPSTGSAGWRTTGSGGPAANTPTPPQHERTDGPPLTPVSNTTERSVARVTKGDGVLPNDQGQVWRNYDIRPYTRRITNTNKPQQALVDWILRETGYEAWHGEPLSILSANEDRLSVYHTPQVQAIVADIVDRFVSSEAETHAFGLRTVTISNPNWRAKALRLMKPVPVQSQGVQGWLMAREDAALLLMELRKRSDYREHSSPHLIIHNGQSTVLSTMRPRSYIKNVILSGNAFPGYEPEMGQVQEGFALEFSPLVALDGRTVDAVIKLQLNQIEKMVPVMLEVPTVAAPRQRARVEVPQMVTANLHERFRWPADQVLVLSMGVVATPVPQKSGNPLTDVLQLTSSPSRADALLFVESRSQLTQTGPAASSASPVPSTASRSTYPGRY